MTRLALTGAALLALTCTANAATAPTQPGSNTYLMTITDISQTGANCGDDDSGGTSQGTFHYPGPGATGTVLTEVKNDSGDFGFTIVNFPKTPAAGVKTWSGSLSGFEQPGNHAISATFKGTLTFVDSQHFLLLLKITEGGCIQTKQVAAYSTTTLLGAAAVQQP